MSITSELREWAKGSTLSSWTAEHLTAIADRIDAEHEKAVRERRRSCIYYDPERHYCSCHDFDVSGYIELPKDADGEYIHVGDVMEWVTDDDDYPPVIREVAAVGADVFFAWDKVGGRFSQYLRSNYRHHHAPTVEDVLREMLDAWGELPSNATDEAIVAEYAAKLRLAEGEDA